MIEALIVSFLILLSGAAFTKWDYNQREKFKQTYKEWMKK